MGSQNLQREGDVVANPESKDKATPSLPPSSTSSPSHDFSFTISLHPPFNLASETVECGKSIPSEAIDLAPADDIFFHGHLLPLHPLSRSSISPRPSDISISNLRHPLEHTGSDRSLQYHADDQHDNNNDIGKTKERRKTKSFSSLFGIGKWRKENDIIGEKDEDKRRKKKKKKGFDVMSRFLKKYMGIVEPLFFFKGQKEKRDLSQRPYSFSGHSSPREKDGWMRRSGEFSAPASMRTSATNSGLLSATSMTFSSSNESTMEELQSAIQAAIAHCKNSIANKIEV